VVVELKYRTVKAEDKSGDIDEYFKRAPKRGLKGYCDKRLRRGFLG
jgi:hypothetical protein